MTNERPGDPVLPTIERKALRRAYDRAAPLYAHSADLAREIGQRQLERLDLVRIAPRWIADLGCGPGIHASSLAARYPGAIVLALDASRTMITELKTAHRPTGADGAIKRIRQWLWTAPATPPPHILPLQADFERLPLPAGLLDLAWSNLALHHALDLPATLRGLAAATRTGGLVMLSMPGPDTFAELRRALAQIHVTEHTHPFPDMHDVGDMLIAAGFADPVVDCERITLEYTTGRSLWHDVRALGAATARADRPRGLTTPRRLRRIEAGLRAGTATADDNPSAPSPQPMRLTVEIVYAHAWKAEPKTTSDGRAIVRFERVPARTRPPEPNPKKP